MCHFWVEITAQFHQNAQYIPQQIHFYLFCHGMLFAESCDLSTYIFQDCLTDSRATSVSEVIPNEIVKIDHILNITKTNEARTTWIIPGMYLNSCSIPNFINTISIFDGNYSYENDWYIYTSICTQSISFLLEEMTTQYNGISQITGPNISNSDWIYGMQTFSLL